MNTKTHPSSAATKAALKARKKATPEPKIPSLKTAHRKIVRAKKSPVSPVLARQNRFNTAVRKIAKEFGVKVGSARKPAQSAYDMSPEETAEMMRAAGILTPSGKLTANFK